MLALRPNCELCDRDLPPDSIEACICSYECTFCRHCVTGLLENVCPNCGGGFSPRPIRPRGERRNGINLEHHSASTRMVSDLDFEVTLVADATAAFARNGYDGKRYSGDEIHRVNRVSLNGEFCRVLDTAQLLEALA
jgi:hypothetical protein